MKVIEWTCPQCGVRHMQTATVNEKAVYDGGGNLLQVEPVCGGNCAQPHGSPCGYSPLIQKTESGWEDVRNVD
jgi:hypothetical protein